MITHKILIPTTSQTDCIKQATSNIITLLACPPKTNVPVLQLRDSIKNGSTQFLTILQCN